jgi:hypothetical protein
MKVKGSRELRSGHYTDLCSRWRWRWRWRSVSSFSCFRKNNNKNLNGFFFLVGVMEKVTNRNFSKIAVSSPSNYTGFFISPSGISELDCATTKTDTAERSI